MWKQITGFTVTTFLEEPMAAGGIDFTTCSICLDTFNTPRILPCGHSFCNDCLLSILESQIVNCPDCRETIPSLSAEEFPINYAVVSVSFCLQKFQYNKINFNIVWEAVIKCLWQKQYRAFTWAIHGNFPSICKNSREKKLRNKLICTGEKSEKDLLSKPKQLVTIASSELLLV